VPEFVCRLGAPDGSVIELRRVATSVEALQRELEAEGFHVFGLSRARSKIRMPFMSKGEKVAPQDFLLFNTQLATLLRAGLPLAQSLELLKDQQTEPHFRALLDKVHQQVTTGVSLSDAFLSLGDVFPRLYSNSLRAGERSGELEGVLRRYVEYQRLVESVRKKIVAALTYPAVLVLLAVGLVVLLVAYVIPRFSDFYLQFGSELPLPTRIVLGVAQFTEDNLLFIVAALVVGWYLFKWWKGTPFGRRLVDRWTLRVPLVGRLAQLFSLSQFTRSMSVLLSGGTPMVPAVETAATSIKNVHIAELFLGCVQEVQEGRPLSDALEDTGRAPGLALAMIRVGESTGALPEMLEHTSDFFDEEIDFFLTRVVGLFEPMILVVMAVIIAGLLLAVYYPLLRLVSTIA
jgi:type IV pilus assembly protein PilC